MVHIGLRHIAQPALPRRVRVRKVGADTQRLLQQLRLRELRTLVERDRLPFFRRYPRKQPDDDRRDVLHPLGVMPLS